MVSFYQALDVTMNERVLILSIEVLDYIPNIGEGFEINGFGYIVASINNKLNTSTMRQDIEIYLMREEDWQMQMQIDHYYGDDEEA